MAKTVKLTDLIPSRYSHLTPGSEENVERIRVDLVDGSKMLLNDPHVFREGEKWEILAGHDRVKAAKRAGWTEIQVRDFSGAVNTDDQILAHFCRENLLRKDISKAAIAGEWLRKHPDWSDGKVAAASGCTQQHVSDTRAELIADGNLQHVVSRVGRDNKVRDVGETPRKPRKKGPLGKPQPRATPAKQPSKVEAMRAQREAQFAASQRPPSAVASEPTDGGSTGSQPQGSQPEVGAPTGADASRVEATEFVAVAEFSAVAEFVAALPAAPAVQAAEYRLAYGLLTSEQVEQARVLHRFLGTFLLQIEIAAKESARRWATSGP